ncbi:MAG: tetratricopeptide repeat protein [Polyangiaceae bacterium]|nr:tetratricopeptide repeat protein [Polyangiaceae bacterium]
MTPPEDLRARALDLLSEGDTAGGISDLRAHLAAEPDDEGAWLALGTAYAAIAHWPDAARALGRAVELDGEVADARLLYARALVALGKLDDAAFQLLQAARQDPPDPRALVELGVVLYDKRLYDKAARWLAEACEAAPSDPRAAYALGLAHEARRDIAAAIAAYREALRRDPAHADARLTLADALAGAGEHEQAIAELEALLSPPVRGADRPAERAARNLEVLRHALAEMRARRLLGKTERDLERSALVVEAGFKRRGPVTAAGGEQLVRWTAPLLELHVALDAAAPPSIRSIHLALTDPGRAARAEDDTFKVTVIAKDGRREPVDFGTAASLTFLREALGCPMTQASELLARLLQGAPSAEWGGAVVRFSSLDTGEPGGKPRPARHGILVAPAS